MIKTVVLCIVIISILIAIYDLIDLYKTYNLNKPNFIPLTIQVVLILLVSAIIINLIGFIIS